MALAGFARVRGADFKETVAPFLAKHCVSCHNAEKHRGDLRLDFADEGEARKEPALWKSLVARIEAHEMPPRPRPLPEPRELEAILPWVEEVVTGAKADRRDPGRVTLRRLNRFEYFNSVRDLLGVEYAPSKDFPADDVGNGFDNQGDALTVPPILLEKYLAAAEEIAAAAVPAPEPAGPALVRLEGEDMECTASIFGRVGNKMRLATEGELHKKVPFRQAGEYRFAVRCIAEQAGPDLVQMAVRVDGSEVKRFDVDAVEGKARTYEIRARFDGGERNVSVAFLNDFVEPEDPENKEKKRKDRNLLVDWVEVEGPLDARPIRSASFKRLVPCDVDGSDRAGCLRTALEALVHRAFRRPAEAQEVDRLVALVGEGEQGDGTLEDGVRLALEAVLVSPHFLFKVEVDPEPANQEAVRPLGPFELATRLSYFLWGTAPDAELLAAASEGRLKDLDGLVAAARRLLASPRARALTDLFASQWLTIRSLSGSTPDRTLFPSFDEELRSAMRQETELFFEAIVREDRSILELLDSDSTFLNERLARHYGVEGVSGPELRRVQLTGGRRGGVLTQASVLTVTSNPTRTSPVKRGKWVLEQLLGTPPPPPPPNVPELKEAGAELVGTLRERMEQHRRDPACSTCHTKMDALGFGLENFDATGAWRDRDGGAAIDASGELPDGRRFAGPGELKKVLLGDREAFARTFAEKLMVFAVGRALEYPDRKVIREIASTAEKEGYRLSSFVLGIVQSDPFRFRRGERRAP